MNKKYIYIIFIKKAVFWYIFTLFIFVIFINITKNREQSVRLELHRLCLLQAIMRKLCST